MPTFLIYHIGSKTAFPHTFASPSVTSGTNTAFCALFSPQVSHQENANLPLAAGSALQNRLASLDPTANAVPPLMMPRVAQVPEGHRPPASGFPDVSRQDENRPLTHIKLPTYNVRK